MATYPTKFHGLPVTVHYSTDCELEIFSVEWRDVELFDAMTEQEKLSLCGEMEMNLQAELHAAADFARQAEIERKGWRKAA